MSPDSPTETNSLYDQDDYYDAGTGGSRLTPLFDRFLFVLDFFKFWTLLSHLQLRRGANVLDVGAGDGTFLSFLQKRGYNVFGTTASRTSQQAAMKKYGLDLSYATTLGPELAERQYDLITYWHVYEHLEDPYSHIKACFSLLREGAYLLIEVPNVESMGSKLAYHSWLGSDDRHHINHQKPHVILDSLSGVGFTVRRTVFFSSKFSYVFLWSAILGRLWGGGRYTFDDIMEVLKKPLPSLRHHPAQTLNLFASLIYLSPAVLVGLLIQRFRCSGEIFRVYAQKPLQARSH
jgi:SAM-dependent methyltransferase